MHKPLLSICIPTYNRGMLLEQTLYNITKESLFQNTDDIQIVISDNCSTDITEDVCNQYVDKYPSKIKYIRHSEPIFPPHNIYGVLDYADGEYLKLQNDNIFFDNDGLNKLVKIIKEENKDIIFCVNKDNGEADKLKSYDNVNDIVKDISYTITWMCAHCYRAEAYRSIEYIDKYMQEWVGSVDVLFRMIENGASFVGYYENIFYFQNVDKKGGTYNVAEVFGKNYVALLKQYVCKNLLSKSVFNNEKKKILLNHVNHYYFDIHNDYNFQKTGYFKNLFTTYWNKPYFYTSLLAYVLKYIFNMFLEIKKDNTYRRYKILGLIKFKVKRKCAKGNVEQKIWKKRNCHNRTWLVNASKADKITVGNSTYGAIDAVFSGIGNDKLIIGNFCSIADGVKFIVSSEHQYNCLSTYPFKVHCLGYEQEALSKGSIIVKDDVWIASNAIILSGVTIGQGAIVGAGAVVTKDVPPYAIVGGNPAKVIKYRFESEIIEKLVNFDFSKLTDEKIKNFGIKLYTEITKDNVDNLIKEFSE